MTEEHPEIRTISFEQWEKEGIELFGEDKMKWKFVCPACGNVQAAEDFKPYEEQGADPNCAFQECIGRFMSKEERRSAIFDKGKGPCDYALFGFFRFHKTIVKTKDYGKEVMVFEFYRGE